MGSVIGKGGSKIKEIQDASGARLNASEGMLPGSTEVGLFSSYTSDDWLLMSKIACAQCCWRSRRHPHCHLLHWYHSDRGSGTNALFFTLLLPSFQQFSQASSHQWWWFLIYTWVLSSDARSPSQSSSTTSNTANIYSE